MESVGDKRPILSYIALIAIAILSTEGRALGIFSEIVARYVTLKLNYHDLFVGMISVNNDLFVRMISLNTDKDLKVCIPQLAQLSIMTCQCSCLSTIIIQLLVTI